MVVKLVCHWLYRVYSHPISLHECVYHLWTKELLTYLLTYCCPNGLYSSTRQKYKPDESGRHTGPAGSPWSEPSLYGTCQQRRNPEKSPCLWCPSCVEPIVVVRSVSRTKNTTINKSQQVRQLPRLAYIHPHTPIVVTGQFVTPGSTTRALQKLCTFWH